jgi:hypothetical protein
MSIHRKDWTMPVITIVGIFVLTLLLNATVVPTTNYVLQSPVKNTEVVPVSYTGRQHVYVIDQEATNKISVLSFSLISKGFLVISDEKTDEVLGVSRLLEAGLYSAGVVELTKSVVPGQKLVATVYSDGGDGKFEVPTKEETKDASLKDTAESATASFVILEKETPKTVQ